MRAKPVQPKSGDRKSTRLNSSHVEISYAVFCLKKKNTAGRHQCDSEDKRDHSYDRAIRAQPGDAQGSHWGTSVMISRGFFFFNDTATTEIYTLSLHDALPI